MPVPAGDVVDDEAMLVSVDDLEDYLQRTLTAAQRSSAALRLAALSDDVTSRCGWHIAPVLERTVVVDGSGSTVQPLPTKQLLAVLAVASDGRALDPAGVEWSRAGDLVLDGCWSSRPRGVTVTIRDGYEKVPSTVLAMICEAAKLGLANRGGVVREQAGGESVTYATVNGVPVGGVLSEQDYRLLDRRFRVVNAA